MSRHERSLSYIFKKAPYVLLLLRYGINDHEFKVINLSKIAHELGTTSQNVSKIVNKLEREGLIIKVTKPQLMIKLTPKAMDIVREIIYSIREFIKDVNIIKLVGHVISGLGEGSYYMSLAGYVKQFIEKLGFKPYPGTLNVKLKPEYVKYRLYLEKLPGIYIEGFVDGGRTYGGVKCFKATISGYSGAVLIIERTHHGPDVIEIISEVKLRDVLGLRDGDIVEVLVEL